MKRRPTVIDLTQADEECQHAPKKARHTNSSISINLVDDVDPRVNQITQYFPTDLWHFTFQKAFLHKYPIKVLLSLRIVCKSWKQVISSFTKISSPDIHVVPQIPTLWTIFPLRALYLPPECRVPDFSLMTALTQLKIHGDSTIKIAGRFSANLRELLPLTNLKKLTIRLPRVTSLKSLTFLESVFLKRPIRVKKSDVDQLPHLTRLVSDSRKFFRTGKGIFQHPEKKEFYEGEFKNGKFHGHGTRIHSTHRYVGQFEDGHRHGQGIAYYPGGARYEGAFTKKDPSVTGVFYRPDGGIMTGEFQKESFGNGKGTIKFPDGAFYEGAWSNWRFCGFGVYVTKTGCRQEAHFKNGQLDGEGTIFYRTGDKFVCSWVQGQVTGDAVVHQANGDKFKCYWNEFGAQGHGVLKLASGEKIEGVWKNGFCPKSSYQYESWKVEHFRWSGRNSDHKTYS